MLDPVITPPEVELLDSERLNERGRELSRLGDKEGAEAAYRAAIQADRSWSLPWYNLGLLHKYAGEWAESAVCNLEATRRDQDDGDAWWNLGIASTALGDWLQAREAWQRCGIQLPPGDGPISGNFGLVPIRLDPENRGEVVWADRVDPARAIVRNVPLPESGYFYGDILLHDGAPNGYRSLNGQEVPVFDALERLERSEFRTYILDLPGASERQRALLSEVAFERGSWAQDWSASVRFLCRRCSIGGPHQEHDADLRGHRPDLAMGAAARDDSDVAELLEIWRERAGYSGYSAASLAGDDSEP